MATSKSNHERLLASIETTYRLAERGFDGLHSAASSPEDRARLRDLYGAARDAYWKAVVASLEDHSSVVTALHDDLKRTNRELKRAIESLEDVAKALAVLTEAVKLAASLVTLGAV